MRLIFQVAVGEVPSFYATTMGSVRAYAQRIGADYEALTEPELRIVPKNSRRSESALRLGYLPIFEKEAAFARLGRYDQVAVIDADVYARERAPDIFEAAGSADFAGVRERDLPLLPRYQQKIKSYARDQYGDAGFPFYNMGVTVWSESILPYLCGQTPAEFIHRPEFAPFVNGEGKYRWSTDQTLLNMWVRGRSRTDLEWRWNCMYDYVQKSALERNPYFVHFALASKMPRGGDEIPEIIAKLS
jgi:hypothetical protein